MKLWTGQSQMASFITSKPACVIITQRHCTAFQLFARKLILILYTVFWSRRPDEGTDSISCGTPWNMAVSDQRQSFCPSRGLTLRHGTTWLFRRTQLTVAWRKAHSDPSHVWWETDHWGHKTAYLRSLQTHRQHIGALTDSAKCHQRIEDLVDIQLWSSYQFSRPHLAAQKRRNVPCAASVNASADHNIQLGAGTNRRYTDEGHVYVQAIPCSPYCRVVTIAIGTL